MIWCRSPHLEHSHLVRPDGATNLQWRKQRRQAALRRHGSCRSWRLWAQVHAVHGARKRIVSTTDPNEHSKPKRAMLLINGQMERPRNAGVTARRDGPHKMGLDGIYRKTVPINVHLIESNAGHNGVTSWRDRNQQHQQDTKCKTHSLMPSLSFNLAHLPQLSWLAGRFNVEPDKLLGTLKNTVFKGASNDELLALVVVANEYGLNLSRRRFTHSLPRAAVSSRSSPLTAGTTLQFPPANGRHGVRV